MLLTRNGSFPFTFSFLFHTQHAVELSKCGGTLIADDIVLSAAHCSDQTNQQVSIGAYEKNTANGGARGRFCDEWITDPNYATDDGAPNNSDFALCKLNKPIDTSEWTTTLSVNTESAFPPDGEALIVMGLGWLNSDGDKPTIVQDVTVPVINQELCKNPWGYMYVEDTMLCAGFYETGGKDSCKGDSGGPIVQRKSNRDDGTIIDTLVGVVSFGVPCAFRERPSVYGRVSSRFDWIRDTMCNTLNSTSPLCDDHDDNDDDKKPPLPPTSDCPLGEELIVRIRTDSYAKDQIWSLTDAQNPNEVIVQRQYLINEYETETKVCLTKGWCYKWEILDDFGDGMLCNSAGCGYYNLTLNGEVIAFGGQDFTYRTSETVCTTFIQATEPPEEVESLEDSDEEKLAGPIVIDATPLPSSNPTISPSDMLSDAPSEDPTTSPSVPPSQGPSQADSCTSDSETFRWKGRKQYTCERYLRAKQTNKIKKKCKKKQDGIRVYDWCPETCARKADLGPCARITLRRRTTH